MGSGPFHCVRRLTLFWCQSPIDKRTRYAYIRGMKNTEATQIESIEKQATGSFGTYNPVAKVTCPHCGGTMQAIDAKKHIRNA